MIDRLSDIEIMKSGDKSLEVNLNQKAYNWDNINKIDKMKVKRFQDLRII